MSVSASTPFDPNPSTTPSMALPCSVSTSIISIELAVAQNMLTISGTSFSLGRTFIGNASFIKIIRLCPADSLTA